MDLASIDFSYVHRLRLSNRVTGVVRRPRYMDVPLWGCSPWTVFPGKKQSSPFGDDLGRSFAGEALHLESQTS
jgi:hypothetical protein